MRKENKAKSIFNEKEVKKAVETFFNQSFDPEDELKAQLERNKKDVKSSGIDWKRVRNYNTLYISSVFDSLEWWKNIGRKNHPLVFLVMLAINGLPASNGYQERIFSNCSWFESELQQNSKDETFEQKMLLSFNDALGKEK